METLNKKKRAFPSNLVILFSLIVVVTIMTYIVPAGEFDTTISAETGQEMVDAETFTYVDQTPVNPFRMFVGIANGFVDGASIIFLIVFGYFWVFSVVGSGAIGAGINKILGSKAKDSKLFIPLIFIVFSLAGSTYGEFETIYGLIPIFIALAIGLGYDAIVGVGISFLPIVIGFASATSNPFTIAIAQAIAGLPIYSGLAYRWIIWVCFTAVGIWWVMGYAARVKADPTKSYVHGYDFSSFSLESSENSQEFTRRHKLLLIGMVITVAVIVVGSLTLDWYISEMSGVFLISGIISQIIDRRGPNAIGEALVKATSEMAVAIVVVGLSRGILAVLQTGNIIDTIVYAMYQPMKNAPVWLVSTLMLVAQNILNFFIPSGSGQASAIMPIMVPLADLAGVNRQIAVLAFQFGDGYSNAIWPTAAVSIMCGISKIPLNKWYKFFLKLFAILLIMQIAFIVIATAINYGPF